MDNKYYELNLMMIIIFNSKSHNLSGLLIFIFTQNNKIIKYRIDPHRMLFNRFALKGKNNFCFIIALLCILQVALSQQAACHYSCSACYSIRYTQCIQCNHGYSFGEVSQPIMINNTYYANSFGVCQGKLQSSANVFGLLILIISVIVFLVKKRQRIFLWINALQTLSMLAFLPIPLIQPLAYLFQSLTMFMLSSLITYPLKQSSTDMEYIQLSLNGNYILNRYLRTSNTLQNIPLIGLIQIPLIMYTILIPVFLFIRSKFFGGDICPKCTQKILKQVEEGCYIMFYFFIQEMLLILMIGVKYDSSKSTVVIILVLYLIGVAYMSVNYYFRPIRFFPNRPMLYVNILQKLILPTCILFVSEYQIVMIIFMIIFRILNVVLNNKKYAQLYQRAKQNSYIGLQLCIVICAGILYEVQISVLSFDISQLLSIFVSIFVILYLLLVFYQVYEYFQTKDILQAQQQQRRNQLILERISSQHNPTQQGIKMQQKKWSQGEIQFQQMSDQMRQIQKPALSNEMTLDKIGSQEQSQKNSKKKHKKRKKLLDLNNCQVKLEQQSPQKLHNVKNKRQKRDQYQESKKSQLIKVESIQRKSKEVQSSDKKPKLLYRQQNSNLNLNSSSAPSSEQDIQFEDPQKRLNKMSTNKQQNQTQVIQQV